MMLGECDSTYLTPILGWTLDLRRLISGNDAADLGRGRDNIVLDRPDANAARCVISVQNIGRCVAIEVADALNLQV